MRRADAALRELTALADEYEVTLRLVASPAESGPKVPDAEQLAKWYEKHDFVRLQPSLGGIPMRRLPSRELSEVAHADPNAIRAAPEGRLEFP